MAEKKLNLIKKSKKWFYSLMGKTPSVDNQTAVKSQEETQEPQEDSVVNDIKMFKEFAKKSFDKTRTLLTPFAKKGAASATDASKVVTTSVDNKFIRLLIRSFLIIFFTIVLIFIAIYLFKMIQNEDGTTHTGGVSATPVPFAPYKPSVYAQDPEVLRLEDEVNILERELTRVTIKEDGINPPKLDYEISF